jgi:hypothetical protein
MALREGGYGQYCPISRAVEVLGERWSLLIVRDLLCGHTRFNDLARGNPGLSRSLLAKRLRQLERVGVVERIDSEYHLTPAGIRPPPGRVRVGRVGRQVAVRRPAAGGARSGAAAVVDPRPLDFSQLPDRRIVLEFVFTDWDDGSGSSRTPPAPSLCTHDPGFEVDVSVRGVLPVLYQVWMGRLGLRSALRDGSVVLVGPSTMVRRMTDGAPAQPGRATGGGQRRVAALRRRPDRDR